VRPLIQINSKFVERSKKGETRMRKIEAIIKMDDLEEVKYALNQIGVQRMIVSKVSDFGSQKGHKEVYRAAEYVVDSVPEFKIELIIKDEIFKQVIETIKRVSHTKINEDGEVFWFPVGDVN
jgi:nitrogen regulatory protein P-II 1